MTIPTDPTVTVRNTCPKCGSTDKNVRLWDCSRAHKEHIWLNLNGRCRNSLDVECNHKWHTAAVADVVTAAVVDPTQELCRLIYKIRVRYITEHQGDDPKNPLWPDTRVMETIEEATKLAKRLDSSTPIKAC